MNTSNSTDSFWTPYKLPATPNITNEDVYSLTCSNGSNSEKNPSQFLEWRKTIPDPPSSGTHVLGSVDGIIQWIATEDCD